MILQKEKKKEALQKEGYLFCLHAVRNSLASIISK